MNRAVAARLAGAIAFLTVASSMTQPAEAGPLLKMMRAKKLEQENQQEQQQLQQEKGQGNPNR